MNVETQTKPRRKRWKGILKWTASIIVTCSRPLRIYCLLEFDKRLPAVRCRSNESDESDCCLRLRRAES